MRMTEISVVIVIGRERDGTTFVDSVWHEAKRARDRQAEIQRACPTIDGVPELVAVGMPLDAPNRRELGW